jgi:hypothetical protein
MAATPDLFHHLGDDMQLWRYLPEEPPGMPYDPAGQTATIVITRQHTAEQDSYPADVVAGGFEFAPSTAGVIAAPGPYDVRFVASDGGLELTFPNAAPLLLWVT